MLYANYTSMKRKRERERDREMYKYKAGKEDGETQTAVLYLWGVWGWE